MLAEGYFADEHAEWMDAECLELAFDSPDLENLPTPQSALELMQRSSGFDGMSTASFWSNLQPPRSRLSDPSTWESDEGRPHEADGSVNESA
jgi:hypothetical protein